MSPTLRGRRRAFVYTLSAVVGLLGVYLMWRATQLDGSTSGRAFAVGLILEVCAVATAWMWRAAAYRARDDVIETQMVAMRRRVRELEKKVNEMSGKREFDTAARALTEAVERADVCQSRRGHVELVPDPPSPSSRS